MDELTVAELIKILKFLPQDAKVDMSYQVSYEVDGYAEVASETKSICDVNFKDGKVVLLA